MSQNDTDGAIELMEGNRLTEHEMKDELRVFLFAKGIMKYKSKTVRKEEFDNLLNPAGATVSDEARVKLQSALVRLKRIVVKGEMGSDIDEQG